MGMRRRAGKKMDEEEEEEEKRKEEAKRQAFGGQPHPIAAMRFDLKNVKLKLPKVPHTIFGRLMSKDDYFPTAVGVYDCTVLREYVEDRRLNKPKNPEEEKKKKQEKEEGGEVERDETGGKKE